MSENLKDFGIAISRVLDREVNIILNRTATPKTIRSDDIVERVLGDNEQVLGTIMISASPQSSSESLHSPFITKAIGVVPLHLYPNL